MLNRIILRKSSNFNKNIGVFFPFLIESFQKFNIMTDMEQCFFLAQALHESVEFKALKENSTGDKYENSTVLGNDKPGDGAKYIGRGIFQITGKFNYKRVSDYFKVDFLNNPNLLSEPEWAVKSAAWFWNITGLSRHTANYDFLETTYRINGGYTHLNSRLMYLYRLLKLYKMVEPEKNILTHSIKKSSENIYLKTTDKRCKMLNLVVKKDNFDNYFNKAIINL